jgi:hypothetical protein
MIFWAVVGVIEICGLSVELDDDCADVVFHVDCQAVARAAAKKSNNAFRMACFILFLSRELESAHSLDVCVATAPCISFFEAAS